MYFSDARIIFRRFLTAKLLFPIVRLDLQVAFKFKRWHIFLGWSSIEDELAIFIFVAVVSGVVYESLLHLRDRLLYSA